MLPPCKVRQLSSLLTTATPPPAQARQFWTVEPCSITIVPLRNTPPPIQLFPLLLLLLRLFWMAAPSPRVRLPLCTATSGPEATRASSYPPSTMMFSSRAKEDTIKRVGWPLMAQVSL